MLIEHFSMAAVAIATVTWSDRQVFFYFNQKCCHWALYCRQRQHTTATCCLDPWGLVSQVCVSRAESVAKRPDSEFMTKLDDGSQIEKRPNVGQSLPTCCWWDWFHWAFQRGLTHLEPPRGAAEQAAAHVRPQCYAKGWRWSRHSLCNVWVWRKICWFLIKKTQKPPVVCCWLWPVGVTAFNLLKRDVANTFQRRRGFLSKHLGCDFTGKLPDTSILPRRIVDVPAFTFPLVISGSPATSSASSTFPAPKLLPLWCHKGHQLLYQVVTLVFAPPSVFVSNPIKSNQLLQLSYNIYWMSNVAGLLW